MKFLRCVETSLKRVRRPAAPRALRAALAFLSAALLPACIAVGPDYREPPAVDPGEGWTLPVASASGPVSYTHLRAHETVLELVCRLLLEKKTS